MLCHQISLNLFRHLLVHMIMKDKTGQFWKKLSTVLGILDHPAADHRCGKKGKTKQDNKMSFAGREKSVVDNIPVAKPGKLVIKNVFSLWSEDQTQVTNIQMEIHHKGTIENLILWFAVSRSTFCCLHALQTNKVATYNNIASSH